MKRNMLLMCLGITLIAGVAKADDDDDEVRLLQGRLVMQNNCTMCHGAPIVVSQRLTPDQWKAEVTKMVEWGSPVPESEYAVLLEYLTHEFGDKVPKVRPARITIRTAEAALEHQNDENGVNSLSGNAERGKSLFIENCAKCHGENARGGELGTNLVNRPILNRWTDFRMIVRDGRNRMPGFKQALDRDSERDILFWLDHASPQ